ncbi:MAG TPA: cupin domain-containing protein [Polyangiaceae bacterium]|nr:cupin domain-containing protein [Polyangiaceae bacterium]
MNEIVSADGKFDCGVWECTPGRFRIQYRSDELVHILEGEVIVHVGDKTHRLCAGDVAYFPAGTAAEWDVLSLVRKLWAYRTPAPSLLARAAGKLLRFLPGT